MQAVVLEKFGDPEVLVTRDVPPPAPGAGEVLVHVHATSVNPVDTLIRKQGSWAVTPPAILGYDVSGTVLAVGPGVHEFSPGDDVYYTPEIGKGPGSYAEFHVADARIVAKKPWNLSHDEAAAVPLAGGTAFEALFARGRLEPWERVLIHGGAGGVGSFAVQLAKATGAEVFSTCGDYNLDLVGQLGADRPIDYRKEDFVQVILDETSGQGVDLVIDTQGGEVLERSFAALRPHGRLVTLKSGRPDLSLAQQRNLEVQCLLLERSRARLERLSAIIERGMVTPVAEHIWPLERAAEAHRELERGSHRHGKIVLHVS